MGQGRSGVVATASLNPRFDGKHINFRWFLARHIVFVLLHNRFEPRSVNGGLGCRVFSLLDKGHN